MDKKLIAKELVKLAKVLMANSNIKVIVEQDSKKFTKTFAWNTAEKNSKKVSRLEKIWNILGKEMEKRDFEDASDYSLVVELDGVKYRTLEDLVETEEESEKETEE
jgi:hypothetical protein